MRRPLVLPVLLPLALVGLSACGGGSDGDGRTSDSPAASPSASATDPLVGTYDVTSVVDRTSLTGKGNTKGDKDALVLVVGCADDPCDRLLVRGSITSGALSRTVALTAGDAGADGERTRTGPCTQTAGRDEPGSFTETATYRLAPEGEGLTGEVGYRFTGCGFDGTSHLTLRGKRSDDAPPYLPSDAAATLAAPVSTYVAAVATLYAGYNGCFNKPTARTAACLVGLLQPWSGTFAGTEQALNAAAGGGRACTAALGRVSLVPLQKKVTSTIQALRRPASQRAALDKGVPQLVGLLTTTHQALVTALVLCVDPRDNGDLGKDGTLASDVDGRLPVPSG
jgi:hypothetical protein